MKRQIVFTDHKAEISAVAVHPTEDFIATGDIGYVGLCVVCVCVWVHACVLCSEDQRGCGASY